MNSLRKCCCGIWSDEKSQVEIISTHGSISAQCPLKVPTFVTNYKYGKYRLWVPWAPSGRNWEFAFYGLEKYFSYETMTDTQTIFYLGDWDVSQCTDKSVDRLEHSHWSTSFEILWSDWLMLRQTVICSTTISQNSGAGVSTNDRDILLLIMLTPTNESEIFSRAHHQISSTDSLWHKRATSRSQPIIAQYSDRSGPMRVLLSGQMIKVGSRIRILYYFRL